MTVKQATIDDLEKVAELFDKYRIFYGCNSDFEGAKHFIYERFKNMESIIFVAVDDDGTYIGFAQMYPSFSSVSMKKVYILNDLYVCQGYRNKGVGTSLLDTSIRFGQKMSAARITLTTEVNNKTAQALYEKMGFAFDDENKVYHYYWKAHNRSQIID